MGCDIHAFIEFKPKEYDYWDSFGGELNLGRNYEMFGFLTDGEVRSGDSLKSSIPPRGIPDGKLSWDVDDSLKLYITEDGKGEHETTLEDAQRWRGKIYNDKDGKPYMVDHPDWHTHSWLTYKEFKSILDEMKRKRIDVYTPYKAVLSVMKTFEEEKYLTRLVFWFDN